MGRKSPSLLMTSILIFAQFAQHIVFSFKKKRLGQADDQPMGVKLNHQGIVKYLTWNTIAELSNLLQSIATLILQETRYHVSLPILEEFGLLSYLTRPE